MEFRVLGALEVRRDGASVAVGGRRQRALLATLLVHAGQVVSVDALAESLWADHPPRQPRNAVQTYVTRLREVLGPDAPLVTRSPGYLLDIAAEQVDASRFERLLAESRRAGRPDHERRLLDDALALWCGPAYGEFADEVAHAEALRLEELRLLAEADRAAARVRLGEAGSVVADLEALVDTNPLRESFAALLMRALAATDRQADALDTFRRYRTRLAEETGLDPSPAVAQLEQQILRGEVGAGSWADGPRPSGRAAIDTVDSVDAVDTRLSTPPVAATSLVGREQEIRDVYRYANGPSPRWSAPAGSGRPGSRWRPSTGCPARSHGSTWPRCRTGARSTTWSPRPQGST